MVHDILLKAEQLSYTYEGSDVPALNGLSLEIQRGRKIACMGANGSGKSTFFLCCNGIRKPDSGRLYFEGRPLDYSKKGLLSLRSKVGVVFQDPDDQLFSANVLQEISFGPLNLGLTQQETKQRAAQVMERLGITPFAHRPVHALSGGQKKLVAIADILVMEPSLILLDEPAAALDPIHTRIVREIIDEISASGITIVTATHDVDYAWSWAEDVLLFHEGRLLACGAPEEVFTKKELLDTASLEEPCVLSMYQALREKDLLPDLQNCPRTLNDLKEYLRYV
ncbi:MAG TPA: energy-coupling factor ABC transporter ATP-binding protein [Candidatus Dorea gallistercoris]|uniref:ABC transporter ATP-binding protein n=1 Tax=Candidatus Dorea gallistercoris TaxID=2838542 RepID=A0A9D1R9L9_9FIRM|nr:energy-coupling factor ABC transporter ATP-binding protein [Candidatus Dorea gallistercoris]